jgi:isopenicillin N synthase-like dioxygenase
MLHVLTTEQAGTKIPIIDLRSATAAEFAGELMRASCVFLIGHGIPPELRQQMYKVSREFFALPRDTKEHVRWPGKGVWYGWMPDGGATDLAETAAPDLVEWYQINELDQFTLWPAEPVDVPINVDLEV